MPVFRLTEEIVFPDPSLADDTGLLAVGGDLSHERLLAAYSLGIFPWYEEGLPILWHSPDPRFVLELPDLRVSRSLRRAMKRFEITFDTDFEAVIDACAATARPGQRGTWITPEQRQAFVDLHHLGFAHSVEAWQDGELAGGLYGLSLGAAFFGESMFHHRPDASKVALVALVERLRDWSFHFVDCQVHTPHLERLGARNWRRARFLAALEKALEAAPTRRGSWQEET
jgi:leucyl/phenylalanyl-tRNA---protein transferase